MNWKTFWTAAAAALAIGTAIFAAGCGDEKSGAAAGAKTYVVATRGTAKPFSYADDKGNLTGYDVEILKEIEKRNPKLHFEFKSMATDAAFVAMDAGQVDLIANQMRKSPAREKKYIFPKELNNYSVRKLVVKEGSSIKILNDLKGKTAAVTTNSEFNDYVKKFNETADPKINVIYTDKGSAETLNLVATDRADAAGEYEYIVTSAVKDRGLPVQSVGDTLMVVPTYFVIRKSDDGQALADEIDKALAAMKADGTLRKISNTYLGGDYTVEPKK